MNDHSQDSYGSLADFVRPGLDIASFVRGEVMVRFGGTFINFMVQGHSEKQNQRMTVASAVGFSGGAAKDELIVNTEELLGGRAYSPDWLIATPTYTYRMVLSQRSHAIYREYMPARRLNTDSFGHNRGLFSDQWVDLDQCPGRILSSEIEVEAAVNGGALVNGLVRSSLRRSGRSCTLQFPIRYFSVRSGDRAQFHAEAGPILVPRALLEDIGVETAESMHIAQIGFNRWDEAEIAIWQRQSVDGASSRWFSQISKLPAELAFIVEAEEP
jgi:hypothetical protein